MYCAVCECIVLHWRVWKQREGEKEWIRANGIARNKSHREHPPHIPVLDTESLSLSLYISRQVRSLHGCQAGIMHLSGLVCLIMVTSGVYQRLAPAISHQRFGCTVHRSIESSSHGWAGRDWAGGAEREWRPYLSSLDGGHEQGSGRCGALSQLYGMYAC